jgi:SRSO17 transposase
MLLPGQQNGAKYKATLIDPNNVCRRHQSMHLIVAKADWDDASVLPLASHNILDAMERNGIVGSWIIDDPGISPKGRHSVCVARKYCAVLGKQDNFQAAVSASIAHEGVSIPAV